MADDFYPTTGSYSSGYDYSGKPVGTLFVNYRVSRLFPNLTWERIKSELNWRFFNEFFPILFNGWTVVKLEYTQWVDPVSSDLVYGIVGKISSVPTRDVVIPVIKEIDYVIPKDVKVLCGACGNIFIQSSRGACSACGAPASWTYK